MVSTTGKRKLLLGSAAAAVAVLAAAAVALTFKDISYMTAAVFVAGLAAGASVAYLACRAAGGQLMKAFERIFLGDYACRIKDAGVPSDIRDSFNRMAEKMERQIAVMRDELQLNWERERHQPVRDSLITGLEEELERARTELKKKEMLLDAFLDHASKGRREG